MQKVVIRAHGHHQPGDLVDVPDGAEVSPLYYGEPGSGEAERAVRDAEAAAAAVEAARAERDRADQAAAAPALPRTTAAPAAADTPKAGS